MNYTGFGNRMVKIIKGVVGFFLLLSALLFALYAFYAFYSSFLKDPMNSVTVFLSDMLMVLILLELAKTIFSFLENDEEYLHSIMETAFIAVLREVILLEIKGLTFVSGIALGALIFVIGFVYYKMYASRGA